MSEQFDNAMMLAMDAYKANNEEECKSFCNQALTVDPKSVNAKALKGAAVLISFSLAGAAGDASEALTIWESIGDSSEITEEYVQIVVDAAYEFNERYRKAASKHHAQFSDVKGSSEELHRHYENCKVFMQRVIEIGFIKNSKYFYELTDRVLNNYLVNKDLDSISSGLFFVESLINSNINRNDDIGVVVKEMSTTFSRYTAAKQAKKKKHMIITLVVVGIIVFLMMVGILSE